MEQIKSKKTPLRESVGEMTVIMAVSAAVTVAIFLYNLVYALVTYKYPVVFSFRVFLVMSFICLLPAVIALISIRVRNKVGFWIRILLTTVTLFAVLFDAPFMMFARYTALPFGSRTYDSANYMVFDGQFSRDFPTDHFPDRIPESATDVQYAYQYSRGIGIGSVNDLCLRITLPGRDFDEERLRIQAQYPDAEVIERENGITIYQLGLLEESPQYRYSFVAFSESDRTITYVKSLIINSYQNKSTPYFKKVSPGLYN